MLSARFSSQILTKVEFSRTIFGKPTNIEFHENPSSGIRVVPCGWIGGETNRQTDRHDEANSRLLQFCERV
jgi:hypothetical protein